MSKRWLMIFLAAVALTAAVFQILPGQALATGSWGLSFQKEGFAPKGPASSQELAGFQAAYLGDTTQKRIYLTFDAGYENGCTAKILDTLKKHNAPAAFFLVGNYIEQNADLVRRMVDEGHTVGNHTMTHPDMRSEERRVGKECRSRWSPYH